jgi:hypothetical protein
VEDASGFHIASEMGERSGAREMGCCSIVVRPMKQRGGRNALTAGAATTVRTGGSLHKRTPGMNATIMATSAQALNKKTDMLD